MLDNSVAELNKDKEYNSENHTLFIEEVSEKKVLADKEKKLYSFEPKYKIYRIYIERFFERKRGLHTVFNQLRQASPNDYIEFRINSGGGIISEGQQFYNLLQEKFHEKSVAYLDNRGYSMGALLFCMANKRIIYPHSDFMFHNYFGGAIGKGNEVKARVKHSSKTIEKFFKELIVDKGFLKKKEFKQMLVGQDFWMDAKELCKRKIATHVVVNGEGITAKEYLKRLKK